MTLSTTVIIVLVCIALAPFFLGGRGKRVPPQNQSAHPRMPYRPYPTASQAPQSFVMSVVWLFMLVVIGVVILGILAPGTLHALLHLFGVSI